MGKMQEMKAKAEESKKRLDAITVEGEAGGNAVRVTVTGNRKVKQIEIIDGLLSDKEQLENLLVTAVNNAIENADRINQAEMGSMANDMLPGGLGSLAGMFKK